MKNTITRRKMIAYLSGHFTYNTMNSWNLSTSYAVRMKIWDFVPQALRDKAFALLDVEETFFPINSEIRDWDEAHDHAYQAGFNGRSGGYLVLYHGGKNPDGTVYSRPGLGMTNDRDELAEKETYELRELYDLVRSFDALAKRLQKIFIKMCRDFDVVEQTIRVPKTIKVLRERSA